MINDAIKKVAGISLEKLTHTVPKMVKGAFYGIFSIIESDKFHQLLSILKIPVMFTTLDHV